MLSGSSSATHTMTVEPDEQNLLQASSYPATAYGDHGEYRGSRALLVSGCPCYPAVWRRVRRCGAAGHAGLYVAASAARSGRPGMDGNAPS